VNRKVLLAVLAVVAVAGIVAAATVLTLSFSREVVVFNTLSAEVAKAELHNYYTGIEFKVVDPNTKRIKFHFTVTPEGLEFEEGATLTIEIAYANTLIHVWEGTGTLENGNFKVVVGNFPVRTKPKLRTTDNNEWA